MLRVVRRHRVFQLAAALVLVLALALSLMPTVAQASGCDAHYKVRQGDSLGSIANMFGTTATALARANGLSNPSLVREGQHLCIVGAWTNHTGSAWADPRGGHQDGKDKDKGHDDGWKEDKGHEGGHADGCIYVVRKGDTLSEIAKWNRIPLHKLAWQNNIHNPSLIRVGQKLNVCK